MRVATWNVNSVNARLDRLIAFLARWQPDIVALQELKCIDEKFPLAAIQNAGYQAAVFGQKTYNGVAILYKDLNPQEIIRSFGDEHDDPMARVITARFDKLDFISAYIPNGKEVGAPQYEYKLQWLQRLRRFLDKNLAGDRPLIIGGDYNVAPTDADVHDPKLWEEKILCSTPERQALEQVCAFGLTDLFRHAHPDERAFSWWDYRALGFQMNKGLRIDMLLATMPVVQMCHNVWIDRDERKGEKPSDHAPVLADVL